MRILGIAAYYHDSAAALVVDGRVASAAQEERFTRVKHDARFPALAIEACLKGTQTRPRDLDFVVFYEKPFLKFDRLLETCLAFAPRGFASFRRSMPLWLKEKLFQKKLLLRALRDVDDAVDWHGKLLFSEHHLSHAASAFYPSPFARAAVLTMDGVGEWATASVAVGDGARLELLRQIGFPHSLGLLYSAFTYHAGFKVNSGEYKLMGLAPHGIPRFADLIRREVVDIKEDGSFRLNLDCFDYCTGSAMTSPRFDQLFGGPPRLPDGPITQREMDLAASIQAVTGEVVLKLARAVAAETGERRLCLAGGVALNCVANGRLLREANLEGLWIQPAAGDAGGALGAALSAYHLHAGGLRPMREGDAMQASLLGPSYPQQEIEIRLRALGARFESLPEDALLDRVAAALAEGQVVGWHQGRMEFGPRALGARSILADPRSPSMQRTVNLKVKRRESFRPFAPSVTAEDAATWFELACESPYMMFVVPVAQGSQLPAVTHVDRSARVQTVNAAEHGRFHSLLLRFKALTACPVLLNTSFNVRGEPIVCTPEDAFRCFMATDIDVLAIGNCFLRKDAQNPAEPPARAFEPD